MTLVVSRLRWGRAHWRDRTYYLIVAVWVALIFLPFIPVPDEGTGASICGERVVASKG